MRAVRRAVLLLLVTSVPDVLALDITQCGQRVPDYGHGVLQADLSCPPAGYCVSSFGVEIGNQPCVEGSQCGSQMACRHFAVLLGRRARLALNGHSITGTSPTAGPNPGILCEDAAALGGCVVTGPGTIAGFYEGVSIAAGKSKLGQLTITGNTYGFLSAFGGRNGRSSLTEVAVSSNRYGVIADSLFAKSVDASNNAEIDVWSGAIKAFDLTANDGGEVGVFTNGPARFVRLTATGNGGPGLAAASDVLVAASTLTGNDGAGAGYDILAAGARLQATTCGRSATLVLDCSALLECTYGAGATLGVCGGD